MSSNWVVQNLQNALETWNQKLAEIWQLITTTPQNFKGGGIWRVIVNINGAVQAIGLALLVLFFVIGMVTCYFDLLTHPIITLGIPMIIYLLLKQEKEQMSLKETIKFIIVNTLLWGIGWIVTNLAKWIVVDILYDRNLIHKSITQFIFRSQGTSSENLAWYAGLLNNWN